MPSRFLRSRLLLPGLFVLAILVRLPGINFDEGHFYHPDERRIAEAVLTITFSPLQLNPKFFAYGSFPFYVTRIASTLLGATSAWWKGYDGVIVLGRLLGAVWAGLTVVLLAALGSRLYGRRVGALAGVLLALTVLHIQTSHFGTNDIPLTFLVLLALTLLVRYTDSGGPLDAALAGLVIGFAVATKFSALPLLLPLAIAVLVRMREEGSPYRPITCLMLGGACALLGFAIGQPYAFLDFAAWSHDIREQSGMVRNAGALPYTNQYVGVPKGIYEIQQILAFAMGPLLGLAAILGTLRACGRALTRRSPAEWVLLSWVVPFFLISASFQVKFPRYLLPIYPLAILWGAKLLDDWAERARAGRVARAAVVASTALLAIAFVSIFAKRFTPVAASEWTYAQIPAGSKILTQHWDEGFPFHLPGGRTPDRYTIVDMPYYEPDTPAKMQQLATELATADYLVFPTKRLYGAITQAAAKYPQTNAYFRLLFAGDLGYTPLAEFSARPSLLGLQIKDEVLDESFSVYDHPKVLVFRNAARLSARQILEKITTGVPSRVLTRRDILLARAGTPALPASSTTGTAPSEKGRSSIPSVILAVLLLETLGLCGFALLSPLLGARPGVWALSKVFGLLLFGYVAWLLPSLGWLPFSRGTLAGVFVLVAAAAVFARRRRPVELPPGREIRATEAAVWGAFLLFLLARAIRPEIYWGEKPMDFSFLNALTRTTTLPPPEPWLSGSLLSYTYFGHFLVAAIGKTLAIAPAVMFNIGIAAFAGLFAAALFAAGAALGQLAWSGAYEERDEATRVGLLAVFVTLLCGNLSGVREAIARKTLNFDYFWATSRVIPNTINEYPFWSFSFADLHAHVLAMPFTVSFVALLLVWVGRPEGEERLPLRARAALLVLLALTLGTVMVTNGWSTPTYVVLSLFLFGAAFLWRRRPGILAFVLGLVGRVLVPTAVVVLGALLFYRPFWKHFTPPERNWGVEKGPFARPWDYLNIFGIFLLLLVPFLFLLFRKTFTGDAAERRRPLWTAALGALLLVSLVDLQGLTKGHFGAAPSIRGFALALTALGLYLVLDKAVPERFRMPAALATFALGVTGGCEIVYVWDRMNTIFKFYLEAWSLLGLASAVVLYELWRGHELAVGVARSLWRGAVGVALAIGLFTSLTGLRGILSLQRVPGPSWTLDGTAYLAKFAPFDRSAYEWLNRNVPGIPVLCEAWGPSYQEFSRVSMNTGLPVVIGWDYHVFQRGHSRAEIEKRKADVETIYTSPSEDFVAEALRRYHVALVYVGELERTAYRGGNLANFRKWTDLMAPVYTNAGVTIFAVSGAFAGGTPVETVEKVVEEKEPAPGAREERRQDAAGRMSQPRGVAVDKDGNLYVADFGNARIQKLDKDLVPLTTWGKKGKGTSEFQDPCGVAVGPDGNVYVADTWNGRVQVFAPDGKYLKEWGGDYFGPRGIAIDPSGAVFLCDTGNGRVVRFSPEGKREAVIGAKGKGEGQLMEPVGVGIDHAGRLLVCDNGNGRLQTFDRDGKLLGAFPIPGWTPEVFSEPGVAVDDAGNLWVTVPRQHEVRAYSPEGKLVRTIRKEDVPADRRFETPVGIAWIPSAKKLVVTDIENRVVYVDPTAGK